MTTGLSTMILDHRGPKEKHQQQRFSSICIYFEVAKPFSDHTNYVYTVYIYV